MTKHCLTSFLLAGLLLSACHSNTFRIKGSTEGIDEGDTLFATIDFETGIPFDTMVVHDGKFKMKGKADSVRQCIIYRAHDEETSALLFLEPGKIEVKISPVASDTRVSGTRINNAWQQLTDSVNIFSTHVNRLLAQYYSDDNTEKEKESIMTKISKYADNINKCICKVTKENIDNELGYFLIIDGSMAEEDRLRLIGQMPKAMRERKEIKNLLNYLETRQDETFNDTLSDFKFP
jgi:hypothetical protein